MWARSLSHWTTKEDPKKLFILKIFKSTEKLQLQGHKLPYILYPDSPTIDVLPYLLFLYTHTHCYLLSFWCDNLNQLQALWSLLLNLYWYSPKNKDIYLYNRSAKMNRFRKCDIDAILLSNCCCFVTKLCPTLCNPADCNPPISSVNGILQARILERVAIPFSTFLDPGIEPASSMLQANSLPLSHRGCPVV